MDKELIDKYMAILSNYGIPAKLCSPRKNNRALISVATSKHLRDVFLQMGLNHCTGKDKTIPDVFFNTSTENKKHLIRGLMDTDGSFSERNKMIRFVTVSNKLARQLQLLLLDF